jgi:hypothetical protein
MQESCNVYICAVDLINYKHLEYYFAGQEDCISKQAAHHFMAFKRYG